MDNNMVSKIWVGISTTNIYLLQLKIQSHLQKRVLWMPVHQNSFRKKKISKISNITFAILHFSHQNTLTKLPSWVLWSLLLLIKPSDALFKMVHSNTKNAPSVWCNCLAKQNKTKQNKTKQNKTKNKTKKKQNKTKKKQNKNTLLNSLNNIRNTVAYGDRGSIKSTLSESNHLIFPIEIKV